MGVAQLVQVHLHQSGFDVEAHYGSIVRAQASFLGVDLELVLLKEGENLGQVLGVLFPCLVKENQPVDVYQESGELAEDRGEEPVERRFGP